MEENAKGEFLSVLNNQDGELGKTRGILVLVGPALDLKPLEEACEGCLARDEHLSTLGTSLIPLHRSRTIILLAQSFRNNLEEEAGKWLSSFTFHSKTTKKF